MTRSFSSATAEQVVAVTEAIAAKTPSADLDFIIEFTQLRPANTKSALELAQDIGLVTVINNNFLIASSLARCLVTNDQDIKASVIRLVLEDFAPFVIFSERLASSGDPSVASHQTRTLLDLDAHRDDIRDTLLSLGTFAQAINLEGGGRYEVARKPIGDALALVRGVTEEIGACRTATREQLSNAVADSLPRGTILEPIAHGMLHAIHRLSREAIVHLGNAIESYLLWFGKEKGVDLAGFHGVNARIDKLASDGYLPTKLKFIGKYLGHLRNAADHGVDGDTGQAWDFKPDTGLEYLTITISFIVTSWKLLRNNECIL